MYVNSDLLRHITNHHSKTCLVMLALQYT